MIYDHNDSPGAKDEEAAAVNRAVCAFFIVLLVGLSLAIGAALLFGCTPRVTAGSIYAAQQEDCMRYPTHEDRRACIDRVRAAWATDGGAR